MQKTKALLNFLKDIVTIKRRKRNPSYGKDDKILWFGKIPKEYPEIRSIFLRTILQSFLISGSRFEESPNHPHRQFPKL